MKRDQFAEVVAIAYFDQFVRDEPVMNDVVIVYDTDTKKFYSQSSLTPVGATEKGVMTLKEGGFGDVGNTPLDEEALIQYLFEEDDDCWNSVVGIIRNSVENY